MAVIRTFIFFIVCGFCSQAFSQRLYEPTPKIPIRTVTPRSGSSVEIPEIGAYRNKSTKKKSVKKYSKKNYNYTPIYQRHYSGVYRHYPKCSIHREAYYTRFPPVTTRGVQYGK